MATITDYRQQWRRDTAANLTSNNPTPENGEPVMESDTQRWKMGNGSDDWSTLPYQSGPGFVGETYDVIDTDSGDVAATTPTSPADGEKWVVVNSGSSGNYVTGLPGSISLGDGKTISFKYDSTNAIWRYEDVIITEDTTSSGIPFKRWAGGRCTAVSTASGSGSIVHDISTLSLTSIEHPQMTVSAAGTSAPCWSITAISATSVTTKVTTTAAASVTGTRALFIDGRWKA